MKKIISWMLFAASPLSIFAQTDTTYMQEDPKNVASSETAEEAASPFSISGYLETYYSYDFGNPDSHERPGFFYSFNRHNEANLNIGFIKASYAAERVRANLALMAGTYAQYNLAAEQPVMRHVFEANAGYKLSKKRNIWLDIGILPSHIGFESAIGKDCQTLTRSILADNSPYYEAGARLSYTSANEKWYLAAMYLNGWQRIQRPEANQTPAFGTQVTYKPNGNVVLNWSTFVGNDLPDSARLWRYFNNFYGQVRLSEKFDFTAGFDVGVQQKTKGSGNFNVWYSPVLIARYAFSEKIRVAARGEYYDDRNGVIINTQTKNGFRTFGYSLNIDFLPNDRLLFRLEGRGLSSKDEIFLRDNQSSPQNFFITTSVAFSF